MATLGIGAEIQNRLKILVTAYQSVNYDDLARRIRGRAKGKNELGAEIQNRLKILVTIY